MDCLKQNQGNGVQLILKESWTARSLVERRSDADKRITFCLNYFQRGGRERRRIEERRKPEERRDGWMRVGKWCSEAVFDNEEN